MSELMLIGSLRAPVGHGDPVGLIQLRAWAMQAADELERLWGENDRLRSRIRDIETTADFFVQDGVSADAMRGGHYTIRSKAQAALGPQMNGDSDGHD